MDGKERRDGRNDVGRSEEGEEGEWMMMAMMMMMHRRPDDHHHQRRRQAPRNGMVTVSYRMVLVRRGHGAVRVST